MKIISRISFQLSVWLFATTGTAACQASLSITNSQSLLKHTFIESVMPSNHLILCHPLLLLPLIFPSIRVFSNKLVLCIRWPKYWSFNFSNSPSMNIQDWFPLGWTGLISLLSKGLSKPTHTHKKRVSSSTAVWKSQFFASGSQRIAVSASTSVFPWIFRTDFL